MQIVLGKIVKPQGLKGEVKIQLSTNNLAVFNDLKYLTIGVSNVEIEKLRFNDKFAFVKLKGIDNIDKAEILRGKEVSIERKDFVLPQGHYLIEDLIDSSVYDENNDFIGKLVDIQQYGAADVWVIFADGREYSLPFIKTIFTKVMPQQKLIVVCKKEYDANKLCE